jgi:hypothetical protein
VIKLNTEKARDIFLQSLSATIVQLAKLSQECDLPAERAYAVLHAMDAMVGIGIAATASEKVTCVQDEVAKAFAEAYARADAAVDAEALIQRIKRGQ